MLLSIGKVAKQLDCSPSTVRRLPIPYVRWGDTAHRRYKQEEVDKFIQSLGSVKGAIDPPNVNRQLTARPFYWSSKKAWYANYYDANGVRRRMRMGSTREEAYENYSKLKGEVIKAGPVRYTETVYFVLASASNKIKIGKSYDPNARVSDLQIGCPEQLQILNTLVGLKGLEHTLHKHFASLHSHGEWFNASDDLYRFALKPFDPRQWP